MVCYRLVRRTATKENIDEIVARGQGLWETIYTPQDVKLYNKLGSYHPDFIGELIRYPSYHPHRRAPRCGKREQG